MSQNDNVHFKLVIVSSPTILIPAMMQNATHIYQTGDKQAAIEMVLEYFNQLITQAAAVKILSGKAVPIFDIEDLMADSLSYYFEKVDLSANALKEMGIS